MTAEEIAYKYVHGLHKALTDNQEKIDMAADIRQFAEQQVKNSLTPFEESIRLLRDLADLQNDAPLEQHRKEWEETMEQVYAFLNRWEGQ